MGRPYTLEDVQRVIANSDLEESKKAAQLKVTEPRPYTVEDVERVIAGNKEKASQQKPVTGELWERASKESTEIPYVKDKLEASRPNSYRESAPVPSLRLGINNLAELPSTYMNQGNRSENRYADTAIVPTLNEGLLSSVGRVSNRIINEGKVPVVSAPEGLRHLKGYADVDTMLLDDYKMSKEEKAYAKQLYKDYMDDFSKKLINKEISQAEASRIMLDGESDYQKLMRLNNKADTMTSFTSGLFSSMPFADSLMKKGDEMVEEQFGEQYGMSDAVKDAEMQNAVATGAGKFVGNAALYQAAGGIMEQIPGVSALKSRVAGGVADLLGGGAKAVAADPVAAAARAGFANAVGNSTANILSDLSLDVGLDTVPHLVSDVQEGKGTGEVAKNALGNVGMNLLYNVGGEAVSHIPVGELVGRAKSALGYGDNAARALDENLDLIKSLEQSSSASKLDQITEPLEQLAEDSAKTISPEYISGGDFSLEDIAKTAQRNPDIPKSVIPSNSKFAKVDKDMSKLVQWYGDDNTVKYLEDFRSSLADFENTGSIEDFHRVEDAVTQIENAVKGKKYTSPDILNKNGTLKRKGVTYTYGDAGSIDDILDEMMDAVEDVYVSKKVADNISTTKGAYQMANADVKSPSPTANTGFELTAKNNIANGGSNVNETSEDLWKILEAGDITKNVHDQPVQRTFNNGTDEYVSRTATNSLANSELIKNSPEAQKILQEEIAAGNMSYKTIHEDDSIKAAKEALSKDYAGEVKRLMESNWTSSQQVDEGYMLLGDTLKNAAETGDYDEVRKMMRKITNEGHEAGVALQGYAKYSRTAEGTLAKAQSILDAQVRRWTENSVLDAREAKRVSKNLVDEVTALVNSGVPRGYSNKDIDDAVKSIISNSKLKGKIDDDAISEIARQLKNGIGSDIEFTIDNILATQQYGISDETIEKVQEIFEQAAKFGEDSKARVKLENQAFALLADEVTTSNWQDKWDAWRYFSMLSKPSTHIRNTNGNIAMNVVSGVKNDLAAVMESALDAVSPNGIQRTKALLNPLSEADRKLLKAASNDANGVYRQLSGSKYGAVEGILGQSKAFRGKLGSKLQWLMDKNSDLLELEDWLGLQAKYTTSLAGYMKANGIDPKVLSGVDDLSKSIAESAREYAIKEAQQATFHEASTTAEALTQFSKTMRNSDKAAPRALGMLVEGVMPFKKTPINIVKTAGRYSPLSILKAVGQGISAIKTGKYTASEVINSLAEGLTGSGILALGVYLGSNGIIRGSGGVDKKQAQFDELQGKQDYSIQIGDKNYTIDWLAPAALPLLVGVELQNALAGDGEVDSSEVINALAGLADPVIETTMMSGISDALAAVRNAEDGKEAFAEFVSNAMLGYLSQGVPSSLGGAARAIDNTRRTSKSDETGVSGQIQSFINRTKNKIPFLSEQSPEYVDAWGRTQENFQAGDNLVSNFAYQFFSPGYYSEENTTPVDNYVQSLYDVTGDAGVLPAMLSRSYKIDGVSRRLTGEEYSEAQKLAGGTAYDFVEALRGYQAGRGISESLQADITKDLYSLSAAMALEDTIGKPMSDTNAKLYGVYEDQGIDGVINYMMLKSTADTDGNGAISQDEARAILDSSELSRVQKAYYWKLFNSGWETNPYE